MDNIDIKTEMIPVLPLRGLVIFPGSIIHFDVVRKSSVQALSDGMNNNQLVFITAQQKATDGESTTDNLYSVGVLTKVLQIAKISDTTFRVVAHGLSRCKALSFTDIGAYIKAEIYEIPLKASSDSIKKEAMMNMVKDMFDEFAMLNTHVPQDMRLSVHDMDDAGRLADYIADNIIISTFNFKNNRIF